jgi:hypothetical protein
VCEHESIVICLKIRIIKGAKIFGRIQLKLEISNSNSSLVQYAVVMALLVHWIACMWGLGPAFNDHSWAHDPERAGCIDKDGNILCAGFVDKKPAEMYLLCLHFAVQAIVMGEAEDHMPETNNDRLLGVVCMLLGKYLTCNIASLTYLYMWRYRWYVLRLCDWIDLHCSIHERPCDARL